MNLRAEFDVGPLSWVKGEIDLAMRRGLESLRAFAANTGEGNRIKIAQTHLHQAHGALQIVGLDGVTRVSEELEGLLADLEKDPAARMPQNFELAEGAFAAMVGYLDSLITGSPNQPLRLFPLYQRLLAARGRPDADPVDLYFPDLSGRPPPRDKVPGGFAPEGQDKHYRDQRGRFRRGLLKWFKGDASGAEDMRAAVEATELVQAMTSQRTFWWVALAFMDALVAKALPEDVDAKRMCNRIEQQFRRLVEGSQNVAERLLREALYQVARARAATPRLRAVQEAYQLERTLPKDDGAQPPPAEPAALKAAREALTQAKDAWNKYASGNAPSLIAFRSASGVLKDRTAEFGNSDTAALARELAVLATWLSSNTSKMSEAIALEVATALLLLENALANLASLGADFVEQSQFVCARLKGCVLGKLLRTAPTIPLLDEMSRKAQERLVLSQVVTEMQANLRAIEQVLDAFFRDPARRGGLAVLGSPLHRVKGSLDMLGETRARDSLGECEAQIGRFAQADYTPHQEDFERIAQTLSGLGFYIEALAVGKADFDAAMSPIIARRPPPPPDGEPVTAQPTVEAQLAQQKREAQSLIQEWKKKPTDTWLKGELQKNLAAMQKDASLVADAALEGQAQQALRVLEATTDEVPLEPKVAQALEDAVPVPEAPAPSPETARLIDASAEKIDAELLGVYLEEAEEVLAGIREHLELVRTHPADKPALTTIRRAFHTLKGSGRMVGLARLGEAAWAVEQTMNHWLQEERAATPALLSLVSVAHDYFADNVARLKEGGISSDEGALIALATQVRRGEPPIAHAVPAPVAAGPDTSVKAPAAVTPPVPAQEELIAIGEEKVSKSLFDVFATEAQSHLETMAREHEVLTQQAVITDALMRAAHTLAGISATVKVGAVRDLGYALEQALQKLSAGTLSEAEEKLTGDAIGALSVMVAEAQSRHQPPGRSDLIERLRRAAIPVLVESTASVMLPEEEGALAREPEAISAPPAAAAPIEPSRLSAVEEASVERRQRRMRDDLDPQLLPLFLEEANDLMPSIGGALRNWRASPGDAGMGQSLQRLLHTLKGGARMAGAMGIGELTHHMETRVEDALSLATLPETLFDALDTSYDRLGMLCEGVRSGTAAEPVGSEAPPPQAASLRVAVAPAAWEIALPAPTLRVRAEMVDRLVNQAGEVSIARSRIEGEMRALRTAMEELTDNVVRLRSQLREIEIQAESQMQSRMQEIRDAKQGFDPLEFDRFTRFQELTRLMAESVSDVQTVHQNLIHAVDATEAGLLAQARLNRDLQQNLMRVRMVPFSSLSERLYRIVRQTAKELGKRVNLDIHGAQVDLDRSVLERITAPFEHLLRNAVTHGVESPAQRTAKGKPEIGEIRLEITQEGNDVLLAIADDGQGLDIAGIREKAISMGLLGESIALSDAEIADFIFLPGFTTAKVVTEIAGRGVGMDVVRTEVAALGGRIEFEFQKDKGTRFTIYLPLTLAMTQAVLVKGAGRTYAIPAVMVEQVQQLKAEPLALAYSAHQAQWQSRRYPFHFLPHLLGAHAAQAESRRYSPLLFLRSGSNAIALHVDEIVGSNQEIVVKSIGPQLQRIVGITGATVLGSGEIVLILNPVLLALREVAAAASAAAPVEAVVPGARPTVMVVDDSLTVRKFTGRLLAREGYEVIVAKDGVEAMEKLQDIVPDVMLVDIEMPRMDGFDLTRNVRADRRLAAIPIIIITSRTAEKHQNYAKEIGASAFLGKPYQEDELLAQIAGFIEAGRSG
ncbi:MAG: hypothetical protein A3I01_03630 [Betaproteobacteria bacterium RIFCSPLOWO2_02_FULL_65_24]|nr:MAG: hypothetical protein A3I01_03630 [Betaproteobacteria bacterium RIFCSPLOWO2_02_FULL_65_24]